MAQEPVKVVVTISGGCCTGVYAGRFVEVALVDFDNEPGGRVWLPDSEPMASLDDDTAQALASEAPQFLPQ